MARNRPPAGPIRPAEDTLHPGPSATATSCRARATTGVHSRVTGDAGVWLIGRHSPSPSPGVPNRIVLDANAVAADRGDEHGRAEKSGLDAVVTKLPARNPPHRW